MPQLDLKFDGDNCWPDLEKLRADGKLIDCMGNETSLEIAVLQGGMASGEASVTIRINGPDGQVVLTETSWRLFHLAARAIEAKIGRPR